MSKWAFKALAGNFDFIADLFMTMVVNGLIILHS